MPRRIGIGCLWAAVCYFAGGVSGYALVMLFSRASDRAVEAPMTGAFYAGPLCAMVGFAAGAARGRPKSPRGSKGAS
jgi:hypothetical protein